MRKIVKDGLYMTSVGLGPTIVFVVITWNMPSLEESNGLVILVYPYLLAYAMLVVPWAALFIFVGALILIIHVITLGRYPTDNGA